ncbi:hypothetical protein ACLBWZ_16280 [Brucellaceae bacterium C25G]
MTEKSIPVTAESMTKNTNKTILQHAAIDSDWNLNSANCYFSSNSMLNHSLSELFSLHEALVTVANVVGGFEAQPRFSNHQTKNFNNAGRNLQAISGFIDEVCTLIVNTAKSAIPHTVRDAEQRAWILLQSEVRYCEDVHDFAKLASGQSAALATVEAAR